MISTVLPSALVRMSPGLIAPCRPACSPSSGRRRCTRTGALSCAMRRHRADHRRAARHVVLHLVHVVGRLDRDAAGVERNALADEARATTPSRGLRRFVPQHHTQRRLLRLPRATPSSRPIFSAAIRADSSSASAPGPGIAAASCGAPLREYPRRQDGCRARSAARGPRSIRSPNAPPAIRRRLHRSLPTRAAPRARAVHHRPRSGRRCATIPS